MKKEPLEPERALLEYYWSDEPVYAPGYERSLPQSARNRDRFMALILLVAFVAVTCVSLRDAGTIRAWQWVLAWIAAACLGDFVSGCAHLFLDFYPSRSKTYLH